MAHATGWRRLLTAKHQSALALGAQRAAIASSLAARSRSEAPQHDVIAASISGSWTGGNIRSTHCQWESERKCLLVTIECNDRRAHVFTLDDAGQRRYGGLRFILRLETQYRSQLFRSAGE